MKKMMSGLVPIVVAAGGGAIGYVATSKISSNVAFLRSNWYAAPLLLVVLGLIIARWSAPVGYALAGLGGGFGILGYMSQTPAQPAQGIAAGIASGNTAAMLTAAHEAGALASGNTAAAIRNWDGSGYGRMSTQAAMLTAV
jgi:hypothetical protein